MGLFSKKPAPIPMLPDPRLQQIIEDIEQNAVMLRLILKALLRTQKLNRERIAMAERDILAELGLLKDQVIKVRTEIMKKIAELEAAINANDREKILAAIDALKAEVNPLDAIVPDADQGSTSQG